MSFPYDRDINFNSEQSSVDPYAHITFTESSFIGNKVVFRSDFYDVSNDYYFFKDEIQFNSTREAYTQVEIKRSLWEALPEEEKSYINSLLFELKEREEGSDVQPFDGIFHDGVYEDGLFTYLSVDPYTGDDYPDCTLTTINIYLYRYVEDPDTGESYYKPVVPCTIRTFIEDEENTDPTYIPATDKSLEVKVSIYPEPPIVWTHRTPYFAITSGLLTSYKCYYAVRFDTTDQSLLRDIVFSKVSMLTTGIKDTYEFKVSPVGRSIFTISAQTRSAFIYTFQGVMTNGFGDIVGTMYVQLRNAYTDEDITDSSYFSGGRPSLGVFSGNCLEEIKN